jgi:phytanoyl-CoA hydroxylase
LALICRENNEIYPELDIFRLRGKASFAFLRNEHLLDVVEALVGPEIICNPIQHIRPKLPSGLTPEGADAHVAPWHQDAGVTWEEADPYFILTVWLPFTEATTENGCLQIIPRTHGHGLVLHHSKPGVGTTIVDEAMPEGEVVTLPMQKGDVLLMHKEIPHRSTPNVADTIRWSADLRYQKTGTPTGRPFYPDFVVRSRSNPATVLTDHATWDAMWAEALEKAKGIRGHRWH